MKCKFQKERARDRGFTLLELLIVVSIMALLAAILFPVLTTARADAKQATCASNLKQIGIGLLQYTQDYDETFPTMSSVTAGAFALNVSYSQPANAVTYYATSPYQNWIAEIQPYVKSWQLFTCPSIQPYTALVGDAPSGNSDTGYQVNAVLLQRRISALSSPSNLIWCDETNVALDCAAVRPGQNGTLSSMPLPLSTGSGGVNLYDWVYLTPGSPWPHADGMNLLFCDGHVKWQPASGILASQFGLNSTFAGPIVANVTTAKIDPTLVN